MSAAQKTAVETLVSIAEGKEATSSDETRIRAACAILDRLDVISEGTPVSA